MPAEELFLLSRGSAGQLGGWLALGQVWLVWVGLARGLILGRPVWGQPTSPLVVTPRDVSLLATRPQGGVALSRKGAETHEHFVSLFLLSGVLLSHSCKQVTWWRIRIGEDYRVRGQRGLYQRPLIRALNLINTHIGPWS